jgi:hypothetical protein
MILKIYKFKPTKIILGNTLAAELSAVSARVFRAARQLASAPIANRNLRL